MKNKKQSKIIGIKHLNESTYILRLERNGFDFKAGQYLVLNVPGEHKAREYSIYSAEKEPFIDLLIKEVDEGEVSRELKYMKMGTQVQISGPYGFFILKDEVITMNQKVIFVATGTGISPFHSIIKSNKDLDYKIILGVRQASEAYGREDYPSEKFQLCTSRETGNDFHGRVSDYLKLHKIKNNALYYLCGNSAMVDEVTTYLEENGLGTEQIKTEVFF